MKHQWKSLILVACIFLFTGSIICMNDILLPALKEFFGLSYVQASAVQQPFFLVYLIFPIPIGYYISKVGYKKSLYTALLICSVGSLGLLPAYFLSSFVISLVAIFVVSVGVAVVNVAANPLAALLGDPSGSHIRVNIVQLFSRAGYLLTPTAATALVYSESGSVSFYLPYVLLGVGTLIFAAFIFISPLKAPSSALPQGFSFLKILKESTKYPQLFWGAIIMFFYMGAEVGTVGFLINYLTDESGPGFSVDKAAMFLTYYYVAVAVFSFLGLFLLQYVSPGRLVAIFGLGLVAMYVLVAFTTSSWNPYYLIAAGGFISIMFPTIFSLSIEGIGTFIEKGSALVNIAIVGGAILPPLQALIADAAGVQRSYVVPALCCCLIVAFGIYCHSRLVRRGLQYARNTEV